MRFEDGAIVVPWLGGWTNRAAEEFALRIKRETGCLVADLGHRCLVGPKELRGLEAAMVEAPRAKRS